MKIFSLLILLFAITANAALIGTPYTPEVDSRFNALEASTTQSTDGSDGLKTNHYARVTFNFATGTTGAVGAHASTVSLPAKAIIQRSYILTDTLPVSAGAGTVAYSCIAANDIFSAASITGHTAATFTEGVSTGTAANMKLGTTACAITATVASSAYTAGKEVVFVEYKVDN